MSFRPRPGLFEDLTPEAQSVYKQALRSGGTLQSDSWKDEHLTGALQLQAAEWGRYQLSNWNGEDHHYIWVDRYAPDYTHVIGRYPLNIRILESYDPYGDERDMDEYYSGRDTQVLCDLEGASIDKNNNGTSFRIAVREPGGGTDFEHDAMFLARLTVKHFQIVRFQDDGTAIYSATLAGENHIYGFGVDPFSYADADTDEPGDWCTYEQCQDEKTKHRIGAYLPPKIDWKGKDVMLEVSTNFEILNRLKKEAEEDDDA